MPRINRNAEEMPGQDSFLDIVANIVGILIILVMVVGVRVKHAPLEAAVSAPVAQPEVTPEPEVAPPDPAPTDWEIAALEAALQGDLAAEASLRADVSNTAEQATAAEREAAIRAEQRDRLAAQAEAWQQQIAAQRGQLDVQSRASFDLRHSLTEAGTRLEQLRQQRRQVASEAPEPIILRNDPTPKGKVVTDHEVHFRLLGGRLVQLPIEELLLLLRDEAGRRAAGAKYGFEGTVGPRGGFEIHYTVARVAARSNPLNPSETSRGGLQLVSSEFVPTGDYPDRPMGASLDVALAPRSGFQRFLSELPPTKRAIVVWFYPDSLDEYRRLKTEMHHLGIAIAGRPLPHGYNITFGINGMESVAQ